MSEINNGDPVKIFIIQVAALSWAATQVPEITVAIQSFLNAGFRNAVQVELLFMIGGLHLVTKTAGSPSFRIFVPKGFDPLLPVKHGAEERYRVEPVEFLTAQIDEEILALCEARSKDVPCTHLQRVPHVVC
jgi:hypothetical protein